MEDRIINLTPAEEWFFARLLNTNKWLALHGKPTVVFRAAGGWVRDKLLGLESHDIDIAMDNMTGAKFINAFIAANGMDLGPDFSVYTVAANPQQSKHLETVGLILPDNVVPGGLSVDFVNLRDEDFAEAYDGEDRILKENRFGTPQVDAQRRDFTVNAIFWNVNTRKIEDLVDGLADLFHERGIRFKTPLDPGKTYIDDPLRMLRLFRFLSKLPKAFGEAYTVAAMTRDEVQEAFAKKVSGERIADELLCKLEKDGKVKPGILLSKNAISTLGMMDIVGLLDLILQIPAGFRGFEMEQRSQYHVFSVFGHTMELIRLAKEDPFVLAKPPMQQALFLLVALLHDQGKRDRKYTQSKEDGYWAYRGHEDSSALVAKAACERMKLSDEARQYVLKVVASHMLPHSDGWGTDKVLRRFMMNHPDCWEDILVHASLDARASGRPVSDGEVARYSDFIERCRWLLANDPVDARNTRPVVSGNVVMAMIPELRPKTGFIRKVNEHLLDLRMGDPTLTDEFYLAEIQRMKPQLLEEFSTK